MAPLMAQGAKNQTYAGSYMTNRPTINAEECADLLICSVDQVEEMARTGEIPGLKIGRGWLFIKDDLIEYLASKAREEAEHRRSTHHGIRLVATKQRRQTPPPLPVGA